jgi:hypothetical protein
LAVETRVDFDKPKRTRVALQPARSLRRRGQQFAMATDRLAPSGQSDGDRVHGVQSHSMNMRGQTPPALDFVSVLLALSPIFGELPL